MLMHYLTIYFDGNTTNGNTTSKEKSYHATALIDNIFQINNMNRNTTFKANLKTQIPHLQELNTMNSNTTSKAK